MHTNNDQSQIAKSPTIPAEGKRAGFWGLLLRAALPIGILAAGYYAYALLAVEVEQEKSDPVEEQTIRTRVTQLRIRDYPVVITTTLRVVDG